MAIEIECTGCGKVFHLPDSATGKKGKCNQCGAKFQVPGVVEQSIGLADIEAELESERLKEALQETSATDWANASQPEAEPSSESKLREEGASSAHVPASEKPKSQEKGKSPRSGAITIGLGLGGICVILAAAYWLIPPLFRDEAKEPLVYSTIGEAAFKGNLADVRRHLARGGAVNAREDGRTPLSYAAEGGQEKVAAFLLTKGADVNEGAALAYAAAGGHKDLVAYLLEKGADPNRTRGGWSLSYAAKKGNTLVSEPISPKGVQVYTWANGLTPLHFAARNGHRDVVEFLLMKGADVDAEDSDMDTPLHYAAGMGHSDVVAVLIAKGADISAEDSQGKTALKWSKGYDDVADLLRRAGAKE